MDWKRNLIEIYKLILKFIWNCKGPRINGQNNFGEENVGEYTLPNSETQYKVNSP